MCEPVSIATAVMAIGSSVLQHQQASMQAKVQTKIHQQNQSNAYTAMLDSLSTTQARQGQEAQSAAEAIHQRNREAQAQQATARVAAGEAGVSGISVDRILGNILGMAGQDVSTIQQNRDWNIDQLNREQQGHIATAKSRMNATAPGIGPSKWATAFNIGSSAMNSYSSYSQQTGKTPVEDWWKNRRAKGEQTNI